MRTALTLLGVLVLSLMSAPVGDAKTRRHPARCAVAGSKTVAASARIRVFKAVSKRDDLPSFYGCLYSRNNRIRLSVETDGTSTFRMRLLTLAGTYVAFAESQTSDEIGDRPDQVIAVNLATGARRTIRTGPNVAAQPPLPRVSDLVLTRSGSLAWIVALEGRNEVHRRDIGASADTVLDSGPEVQEGSLGLARSLIYWTKGGLAASAPIK